jgi:tetratricopeptide (TPR) repeat protein
MRLRTLRWFLLLVLFAIALELPPVFAQSPSDAELKAMNSRVEELIQAGKYNEAVPLAERVVTAAAARFGENAPGHATALNNLAELLRAMNRFAEAEPLIRRALAIDEKSLGTDHLDVAIRLNNLALLLQATMKLPSREHPRPQVAALAHCKRVQA